MVLYGHRFLYPRNLICEVFNKLNLCHPNFRVNLFLVPNVLNSIKNLPYIAIVTFSRKNTEEENQDIAFSYFVNVYIQRNL